MKKKHLITVDELRAMGALEVPAAWRKSLGNNEKDKDLFSDVSSDEIGQNNEQKKTRLDNEGISWMCMNILESAELAATPRGVDVLELHSGGINRQGDLNHRLMAATPAESHSGKMEIGNDDMRSQRL